MGVKLNPFTGKLDVVDSPSGDFSTVELNQGTQTSPSISFDGDPNTGIYSPGADQVAISTGGTGRIFVDADGQVGINSAPQFAFGLRVSPANGQTNALVSLVAGTNSATSRIDFGDSDSNDVGRIVYNHANNFFELRTNGSSGVFIDASGNIAFGTGGSVDDNTYIGHPTADAIAITTANNERARIDSSGRLLVGTSSSSTQGKVVIVGNSNSSTGEGELHLARGATPTSQQNLGNIHFGGVGLEKAAQIICKRDGGTWTSGSSHPSRLEFLTTADGASSPTERMRITSDGNVLIGKTSSDFTANGCEFSSTGGVFTRTAEALTINRQGSNGIAVVLRRSNVTVGSISVTTSATAYNTSSDYRLKENVVQLTGAADRLKQLKPSQFNFIADPDTTVDGFLAHEAQAVVPECVTGTKDAVDDDGNPVYQGIDQSKLVPLLTAALQEALAKIETLEQRLNDAGIA
ncbi:hypothetical protein SWVG_00011 [Synechococcus phage S-RIP1]|uniref:Peptidase S74 domain-containing protein n=1 Tax=Synechococcus phage S-RIP1 TaxID=754041 RepID=M4NJY7_9CAUD|nr:tail fiber protein [Synechococcus phage S-RIP1]AGG91252.1 hypothetical protein SWVG_00011 [Synechococcus phage S-RIP1]